MRLPASETLIRAAVVIDVVGLLLLAGVLVKISALAVGAFMLGSALLTVGIVLYLVAVVRDLRGRRAV
jgi:hypothetical protein